MLARRRSNRRNKIKIILFIFLGLIVVGGVVYIVFFSQVFRIKDIRVDGAVFTDTSKITDDGTWNILFWKPPVDIGSLEYVADFTIEKNYIDRTLLVTLDERERKVVWCLEKSGNCFWIDDEGYVFSPAPYPSGALVIKTVRDHTERDIGLGDFVLPKNLHLNLKRIFNLIDEMSLPVTEVRIDDLKYEEMTVSVSGGPDIYFSLSINPDFGRSVIESLKASDEWGKALYIDLRVENRAYYSL